MRQEYLPSITFCCVCGHVIKDHQIGGNIEGTIVERVTESGIITVRPGDLYFCRDHMKLIADNVEGGLEKAKRRQRELDKIDRANSGK